MLSHLVCHVIADLDVDGCALCIDCVTFHLGRLLSSTLDQTCKMRLLVLVMDNALDDAVDVKVRIAPDGARKVAIVLRRQSEVSETL